MLNSSRLVSFFLVVAALTTGCVELQEADELQYFKETDEIDYYLDKATSIDWPAVDQQQAPEVSISIEPRTLLHPRKSEILDMTLAEAVKVGLENSRIIRSRGGYLSPGNSILANPMRAPSFYDPSIQETGVLFGGRGVEAALSAFDASLNASIGIGRQDQIFNRAFLTGGATQVNGHSGEFATQLEKIFGYGGQLSLTQDMDYSRDNTTGTGQRFNSSYSGQMRAGYRQPLLAGSGTQFTQVAGPIVRSFQGLSGVTQGVLIARINHDISLADLESSVINLVKDIEDTYWDLYLQYRVYDTTVTTRSSTLRTWRDAKRKLDIGGVRGFSVEDEAQARDGYFQAKAAAQQALSNLYKFEAEFRRLIGLPVNDGKIIRPIDEPITARLQPEWSFAIADALTHRVELRRHKWNIKSLELQQQAAVSLVRPRIDFVAGYQLNALGNHPLDYSEGGTAFSSYYGTLHENDHTGWDLGFEFTMPIGLRSAQAQLDNIELRLTKARDVLSAQELEISHEVGHAFQELAEKYVTAQTYSNRRRAAKDRVDLFEKKTEVGTTTVDLLLRALASEADAAVAYYQALVEYNKSIANLYYREGTLLQNNSVFMSEGDWDAEAYHDALRRARARTHALDASDLLNSATPEFVNHDPNWKDYGSIHSENESESLQNIVPVPDDSTLEDEPNLDLPPAPDSPASRIQPPALAPPVFDAKPLPFTPQDRPSANRPARGSFSATVAGSRRATESDSQLSVPEITESDVLPKSLKSPIRNRPTMFPRPVAPQKQTSPKTQKRVQPSRSEYSDEDFKPPIRVRAGTSTRVRRR